MSAWIVSKGHIDALVQGLVIEGLVEMRQAKEIGQMLWHENHLSIQARYGDPADTPAYEPELIEAPLNDAILARQISCYDYQSCEHPEWRTTEAYKLVSTLNDLLAIRNGGAPEMADQDWTTSYEREHGRIPWGIDSITECVG